MIVRHNPNPRQVLSIEKRYHVASQWESPSFQVLSYNSITICVTYFWTREVRSAVKKDRYLPNTGRMVVSWLNIRRLVTRFTACWSSKATFLNGVHMWQHAVRRGLWLFERVVSRFERVLNSCWLGNANQCGMVSNNRTSPMIYESGLKSSLHARIANQDPEGRVDVL